MVPNTAVEYEGVIAGLRTPASMPFVFIVGVSVLLVGVDGPGSFTEFRTSVSIRFNLSLMAAMAKN